MRQAQIAEQERAHRESVNAEKRKVMSALHCKLSSTAARCKNNSLCYYKEDGSLVETSLILYLMRKYHVNVPLRTQGWIKERLASATVQGGLLRLRYLLPRKKEPMLAEIL